MSNAYDDLLNLPHHTSTVQPAMPMQNRAAQFAPFAALVGYDALIRETARLTDQKVELDESVKAELNEKTPAASGAPAPATGGDDHIFSAG